MVFRFFDERKPGRRKDEPTSLLELALEKAEFFLTRDLQKGLSYLRQARQQYDQLDPGSPDYLDIEYRLSYLYVNYFRKQAGLEI